MADAHKWDTINPKTWPNGSIENGKIGMEFGNEIRHNYGPGIYSIEDWVNGVRNSDLHIVLTKPTSGNEIRDGI